MGDLRRRGLPRPAPRAAAARRGARRADARPRAARRRGARARRSRSCAATSATRRPPPASSTAPTCSSTRRPRCRSRPRATRSAPSNVDGAAVTLAAALEAGVRRAILISSTAVYGIPKHHPLREDAPLVGVGHYGESKIEAERVARRVGRRGLEVVVLRPKTFIGPERLGVFEILFDWIREGRRIPILGDGSNRYQLLAVEDLVDATVSAARRPTRPARRSTSARPSSAPSAPTSRA